MTTLQTITAGTGADTRVNENFQQTSPAALYARDPVTTTGLTWGVKGGIFNGLVIADGTVTLTASTTNYVVASRSTGSVSVSTATTNWNDSANYMQLHSVVAGSSTVTSSSDVRQIIGLSSGTLTGGTLTGALNEAPAATLASAASVAIGAAAANSINISGTTTITAFDTIAAGAVRRLVFAAALTLTHNATSLILPGAASITTAAGDVAEFVSLGAGNWRCIKYQESAAAVNNQPAARTRLGLGTFAVADYAKAPFINLMPDSGRYSGKMNPLSLIVGATFTDSGFFSAWNGSTSAEGGKFIHDNTTNGGTAGVLTQDVIDLLAAMGRTTSGARYGVEFRISSITAGSGTVAQTTGTDAVTRSLLTVNNTRAMFGASTYATLVGWIRAKTGTLHIAGPYYLNGVSQAANTPISAGWVHVRMVEPSGVGYDNAFPNLYATVGAVIQIACPAFFSGLVDTGIHTAPLPTINELSA